MLINLTDVFTSEGKERKESFIYEPDCFSYMGSDYRICDKSPVEISFFNLENGKVLMKDREVKVIDVEEAMAKCRESSAKQWKSIN